MKDFISSHREAYRNAVASIERKVDASGSKEYVVNRVPNTNMPSEKNAKTIRVAQSYLQSEITIDPSLTSYNFGILTTELTQGANQLFPTEQRLKLQDVFFTYGLGFFVRCVATPGGNTTFSKELMTYPNPNFYGATGIELDLMQGLWTDARLSVLVNNDVLTPAWRITNHLYVPPTQINAVNWPGGDNPQNYFNQISGNEDGFVITEPNWILNGGNNNQYTITYPQSINNIGLQAGNFRLVLIWLGFLAQNASSIMDNS